MIIDKKSGFKGEIFTDKATLEAYSRDASLFEVIPSAVLFPKDTEDVKAVVKFVNENKKEDPTLSITARSAGTDMSGGAINESIILDFTKHINKFISINEKSAIVEPGCFYRDFEKQTLEKGLIMPSYTASKEICAIGGMVANNSGGEKSIKYGKIENFILRQKVVFSDGNEYEVKPLSKEELEKKISQEGFEGEVYKKLFNLLEENYDLIKNAKPNVNKNSAGYYLWNVWNREKQIFDLNKLLVGSQGTLAITTEVELGLVPAPKHSKMVVVFMRDIKKLGDLVDEILKFSPESLESYDDYSMKLAIKFAKDFFKQLGFWKALKLGVQFIPDMFSVITGGVPKLILMAEVTGEDERKLLEKCQKIQGAIKPFGYSSKIAKSKASVEKYWKIRRESFNLLRKHVKGRRTAPFIDDIVVQPKDLPLFLPKLQNILKQYNLIYTIAGHAGNGNFHVIPLMDLNNVFSSEIIIKLSDKVYSLVKEFNGSITAEHNDGIVRTPFLKYMYTDEVLGLFKKIKEIFDPNNIFNPGKKVDGDLDFLRNHIIKSEDKHAHAS